MGKQRRLRSEARQNRAASVDEFAVLLQSGDTQKLRQFCEGYSEPRFRWLAGQTRQKHKAAWDHYYETAVLPKTLADMGVTRDGVSIRREEGFTIIQRLPQTNGEVNP